MKRIILAVPLLCLSLGGCITFSELVTGVSLTTKSIVNPVTKSDEAQVELALDTAVQTLKAYKRACIAGTADKNCRLNIAQIQAYTRQAPPLMAQLRNFVDSNDQIDATVVYNQLTSLYANVKKAAADLGVSIGSAP